MSSVSKAFILEHFWDQKVYPGSKGYAGKVECLLIEKFNIQPNQSESLKKVKTAAQTFSKLASRHWKNSNGHVKTLREISFFKGKIYPPVPIERSADNFVAPSTSKAKPGRKPIPFLQKKKSARSLGIRKLAESASFEALIAAGAYSARQSDFTNVEYCLKELSNDPEATASKFKKAYSTPGERLHSYF